MIVKIYIGYHMALSSISLYRSLLRSLGYLVFYFASVHTSNTLSQYVHANLV
ncbi:hypothetical protein MITSMUL_03374 [Mitsuokella multacida DSM 20544]|uniref:Uncharacterized protein n=1 Tax=Mitsuokella multacida DSM 20544 TaxID=500635 RepID=C9KIX2_9FIRM|nr:hypothetical protein MITSMUL_03374 [Mitsuokella multacida DSM 20544]